ncbi:MAG: orotidine-5'-phosphate decarboxylase [Alphaproteobacteria bacterium]|nr:orotidine-5'-phosphate decarboxylase [Alphaproteobacteria bacterium]MBU2117511.1 orotidine-5'-phosphate decarboxylase [Alphaproteobacteria bacterium]MBU2352458.1 orotidine-5'-phosphate decarboxylase [Alphaproteobacteria bacterium]MBU2381677.1 orotidine-5'-phosphate decarboxylase [Alphaproteobacteria bacterium]
MLADPRLIVGLDLPSIDAARAMVDGLGDAVESYKIGLTLLARPGGVAFAHALRARGKRVFQDWKLHDIGAQVEGAARAVAEGGCDLLTVHAHPQVMRGAVKGRDAAGSDTKILGVTVLTSLSDADLVELGHADTAAALVERRVRQALDCGVDGVVSSPLEAARVREIATAAGRPDFLIVTPGVRPAGAEAGDQQRVATPAQALAAGATHLVVARPIVADASPVAVAARIAAEMRGSPA